MVFDLNGKEMQSIPIDFNTVCDLEDLGISLDDYSTKPMAFTRAYVTLCFGRGNKKIAGKELEQHLLNGGSFEEIIKVISKELENSDFFQKLSKIQEKENSKSKEE